jgi:ribosome-binding factor A
MPSRRMYQVNELMREEISRIVVQELDDPRLSLATITSVRTSADLHYARVFFHVHGAEEVRQDSQEALEHASGHIRHLLGQRVRLKYIPELHFEYDDRLEYAERIYHKLDELKQQRSESDEETEPEEE